MSRHHRRFYRPYHLQVDFGVEEILDLLDLQASVCVGDDVKNGQRLMSRFQPGCVLHLGGGLCERIRWMRGVIRKHWDTDVNYNPPRFFYDGVGGRLQSRFSRGEVRSSSKEYDLHQTQWQRRSPLIFPEGTPLCLVQGGR